MSPVIINQSVRDSVHKTVATCCRVLRQATYLPNYRAGKLGLVVTSLVVVLRKAWLLRRSIIALVTRVGCGCKFTMI